MAQLHIKQMFLHKINQYIPVNSLLKRKITYYDELKKINKQKV